MEREGRRENSLKKSKLNIVASSVAAISIAASAVAVEKSTSFDPISDSADSANHLVLKSPHRAYEQLIDKLPEVETAEATVPDIIVGSKTITISQEAGATQNDIQYIRDTIDFLVTNSDDMTTYVNQSTMNSIIVKVYRNNTSVLGGKASCQPPSGSGSNIVSIDLADNAVIADHLEGFTNNEEITILFRKDEQTLAHEFGHINYTDCVDPSLKENAVLADIGAAWQRTEYGRCRVSDGKTVSDISVGFAPGNTLGVLNVSNWRAARAGAGGVWPEDVCAVPPSVGGIAEIPELSQLQGNLESKKNQDSTLPIAASLTIGVIGIAGAALYINRRHSS